MSKIIEYQEKLKSGKDFMSLDEEELKYVTRSALGKSIWKDAQKKREKEEEQLSKNIPNKLEEEFKVINTIQNDKIEEVKEKVYAKPNDKVECDVCGKVFTRSNRTVHNKTKYHQLYLKLNKKVRDVFIN